MNSLTGISKENDDLILPQIRANYATNKTLREEEESKLGDTACF